ncbi:MAG: hypothetical protein HZY76_16180 [Anaerolineae bacterium]|nr:MAG: hypothetical protein HZY76_16180 [Anaerolineae bacterium]
MGASDPDRQPAHGLARRRPGDLFAYAYQPTNQTWQSIPFQIDQVDASGNYTVTDEIPTFDSNDEPVLMVRDLGGPAPPAAWLSLTDRTSQPRVAVKVTDPLNPSDEGWVYVFRTQDSLVITTTDYINFNALNHSFDSPAYSAGLSPLNPGATGWHPGLDSLLIKNHVPTPTDILDRTHIRIGIRPRVRVLPAGAIPVRDRPGSISAARFRPAADDRWAGTHHRR